MSEEKQRIKLLLLVIARPIFWGDNYVEGPKSRKKISFFSELILTKRSPTSVHNIKKKKEKEKYLMILQNFTSPNTFRVW